MNTAMGAGEMLSTEQCLQNIDKPHNNDVLCGRGVTTNRHPGNEKFRSLVGLNKELYVTSTKRQKMAISRSIVEAVRSMQPPGRFLEKNPETGLWSEIGDRKAIEKTSQALRDGAACLRKQLSEDLGDPDFLSAVFEAEVAPGASSTACKEKSKPHKGKPVVTKGHRRTKSNPDAAALARHKQNARRFRSMEAPESPHSTVPTKSISSTPRSQPTSPMVARTFHAGTRFPETPKSPATPSRGSFHADRLAHEPGAIRQSSSYDAAWNSPSRRGSWSLHSPRNHIVPTSPVASHGHPPRAPPHSGQYDYYHHPPVSPVVRSWSPGAFKYNSPGAWRLPVPYQSSGELNVPFLHRDGHVASPFRISPLSPRRSAPPAFYGPVSPRSQMVPPVDFTPPRTPLSPRQQTHVEKSVTKHARDYFIESVQQQETNEISDGDKSPTIVVSTELDVEMTLKSKESPKSSMDDTEYDYPSDESDCDPAMDEQNDYHMLAPLPFDNRDDPESLMVISEDLLKMPIAPVGPMD